MTDQVTSPASRMTPPAPQQISGASNLSSVYDRFGKGDFVASLLGAMTALGVLAFLGALIVAGRGTLDYQLNLLNDTGGLDEATVAGVAIAVGAVFLSFLAGGFAAGRMSRYDGGLNGFGSALWVLLLMAVFAALGVWVAEEYNAFASAGLPNWIAQVDTEDVTSAAILATVASVAAMLTGGYVGGRLGEAYHRRVDAAVAAAASADARRAVI